MENTVNDKAIRLSNRLGALNAAQLAHHYVLRVAVHSCLAARDSLTEPEQGLVKSCRDRLKEVETLTSSQEKWLLDIAARSTDEISEEIDRLIQRWANGNWEGEHPTYPRSDWPLRDAKGLKLTAYWHWALSAIEAHGGIDEHCDECGAQLDGDGWDGLCGNCADRVESGEVTREELHM